MFKDFKWSKDSFKNGFSLFFVSLCFAYMYHDPSSRSEMLMLVILIIKHYYDSSKESIKKDETIATMANSIPDADNKK